MRKCRVIRIHLTLIIWISPHMRMLCAPRNPQLSQIDLDYLNVWVRGSYPEIFLSRHVYIAFPSRWFDSPKYVSRISTRGLPLEWDQHVPGTLCMYYVVTLWLRIFLFQSSMIYKSTCLLSNVLIVPFALWCSVLFYVLFICCIYLM